MSTAKELAELARKVSAYPEIKENVSLLADMQRLHQMISDLREVTIDQREEIEELKVHLASQQEIINKKNSLTFKKGMYYMEDRDPDYDRPYCPDCWDNDKRLVTMNEVCFMVDTPSSYRCPKCRINIDS